MPLLFSYAFRPLFLLATLYAIVAVPAWTAAWLGWLRLPDSFGSPMWWHAHEMIYGFAGAAIGGFSLTAVATWTKRPPVSGAPLIALSVLWLTARLLFVSSSTEVLALAVAADLGYGTLLAAIMTREVVGARNGRNYKVLLLLASLLLTNALFFGGVWRGGTWAQVALWSGLWVVVVLINLIAGRIVPAFTRNWLQLQSAPHERAATKLPPAFDGFDLLCTWLMVAFATLHVGQAPSAWVASVGVAASAAFFVRLARWRGTRTAREPLVWVLHVAFAWLPIGFLLLALAAIGWLPRSAGVHALTSGAIATMVVAVAGRAALGHTGRPLESHPLLTAAYILITMAAIARVAATFGLAARVLLVLSATAWCLGFACFAWRYVPILTQRSAEPPGSLPTA